jgi:hypothetical protein
MTDLERVAYAKTYIEKLANGINPLDDSTVGADDIVNNVHISRCLFFASDILRQVYENGGVTKVVHKIKKNARPNFEITNEQLAEFKFSKTPIYLSEIVKQLNNIIDIKCVKKLKFKAVQGWLIENGYLKEFCDDRGKTVARATYKGEAAGISSETRQGQMGVYTVTLYNRKAQQLIIDNINEIAAYVVEPSEKRGREGSRWDDEQDKTLVEMFKDGITINEIALTMKRRESGIRARLVRLGLIAHRTDI